MELYQWIKMHRHLHLTLGEATSLSQKEPTEVVILDRNFEETKIWDKIPKKKPISPQEMFEDNQAKITSLGGYRWKIEFDWGETIEESFHVNVSSLNTNWNWVPIEDGEVVIDHEVLVSGESLPDDDFKEFRHSWKKIHPRTRVGWRGPIIRWSDLEGLSKVYWEKS